MYSKCVYEAIDRTYKDIRRHLWPSVATIGFGGFPLMFTGSFRQILPIIKNGNALAACANILQSQCTMTEGQAIHSYRKHETISWEYRLPSQLSILPKLATDTEGNLNKFRLWPPPRYHKWFRNYLLRISKNGISIRMPSWWNKQLCRPLNVCSFKTVSKRGWTLQWRNLTHSCGIAEYLDIWWFLISQTYSN